ncbi:MAG: 50S ribosomal protein L23 [Pirellulaceae bacterium]|nr:MAG: 50S ribosomal protein L23 [Pirellulaceae bacterium]
MAKTKKAKQPSAKKRPVGTGKLELQPHEIIVRPLVTEKGVHRATRYNQYAFEVHPLATKVDVRRAVEELFEVKVEKVKTQNRQGKLRRYRYRVGRTGNWKKAIVKLGVEHRIDFF